ncbi:hypothetical protein [Flagellimonas algicola]|uniref:Lipocalin-like protein n=1 Tax=Flagellimonas algicola TaxID=2583815 RepID=A0ABY2WPJ4_9FLAO|nr:hypothetical protein [Allomuricauda algicola]TMU56910.1 hypothetical protein FGG15_05020 [Allomuricauda algicola]
MKKHNVLLSNFLPFILTMLVFLNACKKDDSPTPIDPIVGTWKLTGASVNGSSILGTLYVSSTCAADDQFILAEGSVSDLTGSTSVDIGDLNCYDPAKNSDIVQGGTWLFNSNKTQVTITLPAGTGFPISVLDIQDLEFPSETTMTGVYYSFDQEGSDESVDLDIVLTRQD